MTDEFETHRQHLQAVAYRMLGSASEAEDAVQESWLRLSRSDTAAVENMGGWLTTVVARVCLDMLRSRRARREDYVGTWLPEPVVTIENGPEDEAVLADSVGLALLVVLDKINIQNKLGLDFTFTDLGFGVFGFLLVIMMILRPEGLLPERRRKMELTEGTTTDEGLYEVRA